MEMQKQNSTARKHAPTQRYLHISEVKDNAIVLKDGSLRAVIAVSSTNFALRSEDEQNALTASYQSFLNSLDFPVQILIHSRVLDINSYLEKLRTLMAGQTNELLRIQMTEYIEYVARLVEYASIMSKSFYMIVPYSARAAKDSFFGRLGKVFNPASEIALHEEDFEKAKTKLDERVNHVVAGLGSIGLRSIILETPELVELLYESYNFDSASPFHAEAMEEIELSV